MTGKDRFDLESAKVKLQAQINRLQLFTAEINRAADVLIGEYKHTISICDRIIKEGEKQ